MILEEWRKQAESRGSDVRDERLDRIHRDVEANKHRGGTQAQAVLRELLPIMGQLMPIAAAVLLFAHGLAAIHHAFRMHRVVRRMEGSDQAQYVLNEIHERLDRLEAEEAEAMVELLVRHYRA